MSETETKAIDDLDWQPVDSAPWQTVVWVRNSKMEEPVKATRGYVTERGAHPNQTFFTTVYTPHRFFPTPAGKLVCPDEWAPVTQGPETSKQGI